MRNRFIGIITALVVITALFSSGTLVQAADNGVSYNPEAQAVNPNISPKAQAVLDYITGLPNRSDNRIISGQFGFYGDAETPALADEALLKIYQQSGKKVAMTGIDYNADYVREKGLDAANAWVISRWNEGYLINISWHAPNPFNGNPGASEDNNFPSVRQLITPGNANYTRWQNSLKTAADGLVKLRDAGVVVIWRPFHEMNGAWFWWHQQTQADFRDLWINMFNYFTNTRGLNNLLWGYSPNYAWDQWAPQVDYYYPGSAYVDIVGLDFYGPRNMDVMELDKYESYKDLVALNKPIGLFEFGPSPANGSGWQDAPYDYSKLARDIKAMYPKIVFFQAWEWIWQIGRHANASGLMSHSWVISKDELPSFSGGAAPTSTTPAPTVTTPAPTSTTPAPTATTPAPTNTVTPAPNSGSLYRAVNVNGDGVTIDGKTWDAESKASNFSIVPSARFCSEYVNPAPSTDTNRKKMLQCAVQHWSHDIKFTNVPQGKYQVYVHVWQSWNATNVEPINFYLQGKAARTGYLMSKTAGAWERLGPWTVDLTSAGTLTLTTQGDVVNIAGIEVWDTSASTTPTPTNTPTSTPTSTPSANGFYRGVNLNGPAVTIDGNKWDAEPGASKLSVTAASRFCKSYVAPKPTTDAERTRMIQCSVQHWQHAIKFTNVPQGKYQVYAYVWQDYNASNTQAVKFYLQAKVVQSDFVMTKKAGDWKKLGPWAADVAANGTLTLTTRGDVINISGIEIWKVSATTTAVTTSATTEAATAVPTTVPTAVPTAVPTEAPATAPTFVPPTVAWSPAAPAGRTFYRGLVFSGPDRTIDGNKWEAADTATDLFMTTVNSCDKTPGAGCAAMSVNLQNVAVGKYEVYVYVPASAEGQSYEFLMGTRRLTVRAKNGMVGPFAVSATKSGLPGITLRGEDPTLLAFSLWKK